MISPETEAIDRASWNIEKRFQLCTMVCYRQPFRTSRKA